MFLKRAFFKFALGICRAAAGIVSETGDGERDGTGVSSLGSLLCEFLYNNLDLLYNNLFFCNSGDNTLGVGESILTGSEIVSILCSCVANVSNAFLTGSPASKLGVVVDEGLAKMVMISVAACFRKSTSLTCGNGTLVEKNVTVSQSRICFVRGK